MIKELIVLISATLVFVSLIILQLKILNKHHPNAELVIELFEMLSADQKTSGDQSNG